MLRWCAAVEAAAVRNAVLEEQGKHLAVIMKGGQLFVNRLH